MSLVGTRKKGTTRRGFVKNITAGAGGIALASSLREALTPNQSGLIAAPEETPSTDGTKYGKYFLSDNHQPPKANDFVSLNSHSSVSGNSQSPDLLSRRFGIAWSNRHNRMAGVHRAGLLGNSPHPQI